MNTEKRTHKEVDKLFTKIERRISHGATASSAAIAEGVKPQDYYGWKANRKRQGTDTPTINVVNVQTKRTYTKKAKPETTTGKAVIIITDLSNIAKILETL